MNDSRLRSIVLSGVCSMEEASEMASTLLRAQESKTYSNTITPRFKPLERMGKIERTEDRGPGRGKSTQIVWAIR